MDLTHGGHLTHGSPVNFSGKFFTVVSYGVRREDERLDVDAMRELARQHRPKMIVVGYSAYPRTIDFQPFRAAADEVGAVLMVDIAHFAGLVAAGIHPSPVPLAEFVTTTTHKTLRGPRGGMILCQEAYAKSLNSSVFPGNQGGPLMHVIAAKAVALHEAAQPAFRAYQQQIVDNARALAAGLVEQGLPPGVGRHRQPPHAARPAQHRADRQAGPGDARGGAHHGEPQHGAVRDPLAVRHQRRPHRHAGGDDARHAGGGDARSSPT